MSVDSLASAESQVDVAVIGGGVVGCFHHTI